MLISVSTWMGDYLQTSKSSECVTVNHPLRSTHPGHPSLGRHSEYQCKLGLTFNRHIFQGTSPVSVV